MQGLRLPANFTGFHVVSSPLARAVETARIVTQVEPVTDTALIEMNWGQWEGGHGAKLRAEPDSGYRDMEHWGWDFRPPNGESPTDVRDRLRPWLSALQNDAVAVCHIGIMRVILAQAWGWNFAGPAPFKIKRNRLYIVDMNTMTADPDPIRLPKRETLT